MANSWRNDLRRLSGTVAIWALVSPAGAEWHGKASFLTDYVYRGYSLSRGNPVFQGELDYEHESGLYGGLAISQVGFDDKEYGNRAQVQFKPYLGWTLPLAEHWRADFAATGYIFDGPVFGRDSNFSEIYASLNYRQWLTARIAFAPDAYQRGANTLDYEIQGRYDLFDNVQLSAGLGFYQAGQLLDYEYFYWNAGVTWFVHRYVAADLRYVDMDIDSHPHPGEPANHFNPRPLQNKVLFSISVGF